MADPLICPHCGASTAFQAATITGNGIDLEQSNEAHTRFVEVRIGAQLGNGYPGDGLALAVCQACKGWFVAQDDWHGDWRSIWPLRTKKVSDEVPEPIKTAFNEALVCFAVDAYGGCLLMCRTALLRLLREQKV